MHVASCNGCARTSLRRQRVTGSGWQRGARSATSCRLTRPYFVRGQKKPRSPSPLVRGTTCTWRWATLWLTTLLLATNVPCAPSASGNAAATVLHAPEERTDRSASRSGSVTTWSRRHHQHVPGEQRRAVEERHGDVVAAHHVGRRGAVDDRAEHASGRAIVPPEYGRWRAPALRLACIHPPTAAVGYTSAHDRTADDPPTDSPTTSTRSGVDRPPARVRAPCPSADGAAHRSGRRP